MVMLKSPARGIQTLDLDVFKRHLRKKQESLLYVSG